jgi:syntaxin-binding protein 1
MQKASRQRPWSNKWFPCSTAGKSCKSALSSVALLLNRLPRNLNKVRIIALYVQYRDGVPDEDRRRLYQHAKLNLAEQDAVNALVHFGVRVTRVCL